MGEPNNPCFKPNTPYLKYLTTTTTTTTISPEIDFFILPTSGFPCPVISFDQTQNEWEYPPVISIEKNIFTCSSELYDPNPCVLEVDKYLRVADLDINVNRCFKYKLILSDIITPTVIPPFEIFTIQNNRLYINSKVLDFGMPSGYYSVTIKMIDTETNYELVSRTHIIQVIPCDCVSI